MRMPDGELDVRLFAPCGMNCMVCYRHCYHPKPCAGCLASDQGKPEHCRNCKIKDCAGERGHKYCYACAEFPCKRMKSLEKSYKTRYHASLVENSLSVKAHGLAAFMAGQKAAFTCPACGGVISLHDAECSECHEKIAR